MTVLNCHARSVKVSVDTAPSGHRALVAAAVAGGGCAGLEEADEREMAQRRHRAALHQPDTIGLRGPARVALERELAAPAKLARRRLEPFFEGAPQTGFGSHPAHQDDFAARLEHA